MNPNNLRLRLLAQLRQACLPVMSTLSEEKQQLIGDALSRLSTAIAIKRQQSLQFEFEWWNFPPVSIEKVQSMELLSLDELLEVSMVDEASLSLQAILIKEGQFEHVIQNLNKILNKSNDSQCYLSNISAIQLCQLVKEGNIEAIKNAKISRYRVSELTSNAVKSFGASYFGYYNAMHIAAYEQKLDIVRYFVEKLQGRLDINAGRQNDLSVLNCQQYAFSRNADLKTYLEQQISNEPVVDRSTRRSYKAILCRGLFSQENVLDLAQNSPLDIAMKMCNT